MQDRMTIGQLANIAGVANSAIRFYERLGLLRPAGRTSGNYRYYGADAQDRLTFIRAAQATGFELSDIRSLLAIRDGGVAPCGEVRTLVTTRLSSVRGQLRRLRDIERLLLHFERACEHRPRSRPCPVLQDLSPPTQRRARAR